MRTSDVFTPAKLPRVTDVNRTAVTEALAQWVRRGGYFVSVLGTTKLGKTTLVRRYLETLDSGAWSSYLPGQNLQAGASDLWLRLAAALEIPTSTESGKASSDRATWGFASRLSVSLVPGVAKASAGANVGGQREKKTSSTKKFDIDARQAVTEAIQLIRDNGRMAVIAIDDFHFVTSVEARRDIVLALRPLTDVGCSVILSTIPGGASDAAFDNTNIGGRRKKVLVPKWKTEELAQIAVQGFQALSLTATEEVVNRLVAESFGSPQIMQQLCLDLCEIVNHIEEGDHLQPLKELDSPADWSDFFRALEDDEASGWVGRLAAGPNPRKKRKKRNHPGPPPRQLDGYQLIMLSLHELGSPDEVPLATLKDNIGRRLNITGTELNKLALELKVRNLGLIASRDTQAALRAAGDATSEEPDEDESNQEEAAFSDLVASEAIPQPVFEVRGERAQATIHILDPLLRYSLKWHPDVIETARP